MKLKALFLGIFLAFSTACGTTKVYDGPLGDHPVIAIEYFRSTDVFQPQFWKRNTILNISNPSQREMNVAVDCEETRMVVNVAPRTTQQLLLLPKDGDCFVIER